MPLSGNVFGTAQRQLVRSGPKHCRTLDSLHLGAMEDLGIERLMTSDRALSVCAERLGLEVLMPGASTK